MTRYVIDSRVAGRKFEAIEEFTSIAAAKNYVKNLRHDFPQNTYTIFKVITLRTREVEA